MLDTDEEVVACPCGKTPPSYRPLAQFKPMGDTRGGRCYCTRCGEIYENGSLTGKKVATMQESGVFKKESGIVKALCYVSKIDWRSLLLLITALTGACGFVWNKVELYVQQYNQREVVEAQIEQTKKVDENQEVTGGAYDAMATRMDELFLKVEHLEKKAHIKTHYVPVTLEVPPPPEPDAGDALEVETVAPLPSLAAKPETVSKRFMKARLPEFDAVQAAVEVDLEEFIEAVKAQ